MFVLTGGPGSGKTSLLEHLRGRGLACVGEGGRAIIREELAHGGNALPWGDRQAFCRRMFEHAASTYAEAHESGGTWLFDRGLPDVLGYARLCGLAVDADLLQAARQLRYQPLVLLAPPWEAIYHNDAERKQDFAEAQRTAAVMREVYGELGYQVVELPLAGLEARADFVLEHLQA
ncbi:Predicted ATPase [Pseudomonas delhiensis]|uniref:Predicted ATPase n=1 Tax=Pseudomonas delhiensis TaxID=366289 RepID=A0A239MXX4_9PSED|nr:AAA family ATPase [Pseudomonas delhiensis]SDK42556.1 Predicted ATPase [Pseudomonas delhiensis]SNT47485.1 Predicted ATPase [Pseudomonas delhiensis]